MVNCAKTSTREKNGKLVHADPFKVFLLNKAQDLHGFQVVLSSSWRHSKTWREDMKAQGFVFEFLDRTPIERGPHMTCRGDEIQAWLDAHPEVTRYAILDDDDDMLKVQITNFFKTTWEEGLLEETMDRVIAHLNQ